MPEHAQSETELRKYLLDELTQEERARVEERLFLDSDYFQQLQATEDELIDEYAYQELSPRERKGFESQFLSDPARRADLRIAVALKKYVALNAEPDVPSLSATSNEPQQSVVQVKTAKPSVQPKTTFREWFRARSYVLRPLLALLIIAIALGGIWLIYKAVRQPQPGGQAQLPTTPKEPDKPPEVNRNDNTGSQNSERNVQNQTPEVAEGGRETTDVNRDANRPNINTLPARRPPARVLSFILIPGGGVRDAGGAITPLKLAADAGSVNLQLPLIGETSYRSFRATLFDEKEVPVKEWRGLKSSTAKTGSSVFVNVPAKLFKQQRYRIELSGAAAGGETEVLNKYHFQVVRD